MPPQFAPPSPPGNTSAVLGGAPSARYAHGVNGPALYKPFFSTSCLQAATCSAVVSETVTRSSGLNATRAIGGGLTGIGCVGNACSPGTSLAGTERSSTPKIGWP